MGFAVASKGAPLAGLLKKFLLAAPAASALGPRSVPGACRLFTTGPRAPASLTRHQLKVAMLAMGKEQVKLSAYPDALVKWEAVKGSDGGDEDPPASYSCRISLSAVAFKLDQTKAEMKDGVLTVTVPRIKGEVDRKCVDIKIE